MGSMACTDRDNSLWPIVRSILVGAIIGLLVVKLSLVYLLAFAGVAAVVAVSMQKPEWVVLVIVVTLSSLVYVEDLPLIPLGIGSLHITDVLLLVLCGITTAKRLSGKENRNPSSPLGAILVLFMLSVTVSAVISIVYFRLDFNDVIRVYRVTSYYLMFFVITNLITSKEQIQTLTWGLFLIAVVVALAMTAQAIVGESFEFMPGRVLKASSLNDELDAIRILPPGQTLVYVTFVTAICFVVWQSGKRLLLSRYYLLFGVLGLGVLLTYNRSYLVSVLVSLVCFLALSGRSDRKKVLSLVTRSVSLLLLVTVLGVCGGGRAEKAVDSLSRRYLSLFAGEDLMQSGSISDRSWENWYALQQIQRHPLLGSGLGIQYRPAIYGPKDEITHYVHNVYLWLLLDFGLPGLLLFLTFFLGFITRGVRWHRSLEDPFLRSVATGSLLAGISLLPMAFMIPLFMEWHSVVVISIFAGLSESIIVNHATSLNERPGMQGVGIGPDTEVVGGEK